MRASCRYGITKRDVAGETALCGHGNFDRELKLYKFE